MTRILSALVLFLAVSLSAVAGGRTRVAFINPGYESEEYWAMVSSFMTAAARELDMDLEVLYSDRDHLKMVDLTKEVCDRQKKPDFLILVNEKLAAPAMLEYAESRKVKSLLILNDLNDDQKKVYGTPRKKFKYWLGTLIPDNVGAGYQIADALFQQADKTGWKNLKLVSITGVIATPAGSERQEGLHKALKEHPKIELLQEFPANWEEKEAYDRARQMFTRYPDVNLIWAANDLMATGTMKAAVEAGKTPGKDILFGGLNWSKPGLEAVRDGRMVVTVGGHFMVGGWALVLLYDYEHGIDFSPFEMSLDSFSPITSRNVDQYMRHLGKQEWEKIDFTKFTKKHNPALRKYNFSLEDILKKLKP